MHVFDAELGIGCASIVVLDDRVADIYRITCLDVVKEVGHIEGDCRNMVVRVGLLDKFKLEVSSFSTYLASHSVIVNVLCKEYRSTVARTERLELL